MLLVSQQLQYHKDDKRDGKYVEKDKNGNIVSQGMYILGNKVQ